VLLYLNKTPSFFFRSRTQDSLLVLSKVYYHCEHGFSSEHEISSLSMELRKCIAHAL